MGTVDGNLVARIRMAHHTGGRVVAQHPTDAAGRVIGAVSDDHHAGVLGEAHTDPATVV